MFYKTFRNHKNCEDSGWQYRQHLHNVKVLWLRNSKHSFTVLEQLSEVTNTLPLEVIESHHMYNVHKMCLVPINTGTSWLSFKHDIASFWFSVRQLEYWIFSQIYRSRSAILVLNPNYVSKGGISLDFLFLELLRIVEPWAWLLNSDLCQGFVWSSAVTKPWHCKDVLTILFLKFYIDMQNLVIEVTGFTEGLVIQYCVLIWTVLKYIL